MRAPGPTTIGVDVGGTKVLGMAVDPARPLDVLAEERVPTPEGGEGLVEVIVDLVERLTPGVDAIGLGVPGLVDRQGTLHVGAHLRRLHRVDLATELRRRTGATT